MPVTLAQASLNAASDIDRNIIDEFRKSSFLLDRLQFDQSVNPAGGGSTLTYGYTRQITQRSAAFRAINTEYTPAEVTKQQYTVDLRPLGGSFQIDRVLEGIGAISEVAFQLEQLIKASRAFFADQAINGDSAVDANGFDGLSKALTGSSTEINATGTDDWTGIDTQVEALQAIQRINTWLGLMDGAPSALLMNSTAKSWFSLIAALSGQLRSTQDAFGRPIETFRDIALVDLGEKAGSANPVVGSYGAPNEAQVVTLTSATGGTFTLTWNGQTTAAIAFDAPAAAVQAALEALSNIAVGDVTVSGNAGGPYTVTFKGQQRGVNVAAMTATDSTTGSGHNVAVTTGSAGGATSGYTDIYAVRFGLDGFHAVSVVGQLLRQWLPDFTTAGAVKTGEVEMGPLAPVLKSSRAAGVYRNVKVA